LFADREVPPSLSQLLPLFLVSMVAIGVEIAMTRFFALASWAEYGYWVISIAMVGLTASGVVASLFTAWLKRNGAWLLPVLPLFLIVAAAGGWHAVTLVPFNPLELQNRVLWRAQVGNILQYYAALFPFFFLVYTDVWPLAAMLATQLGALRRRYVLAAVAGLAATLLRQDMIVWVGMAWLLVLLGDSDFLAWRREWRTRASCGRRASRCGSRRCRPPPWAPPAR